ncbi:MAG: hypothetical protein FWF35_00330 [Elusimicrobia bacterium]|nr:hypothetical protein [Elusimicrobiota bacterium]
MSTPKEETHVYKVIQGLKDKTLDASFVKKEARIDCVEVLSLEGGTLVSMAELFKVSEKTIKRDLEAIADRNALNPDPDIIQKAVGDFMLKTNMSYGNLVRMARSKDGSISERAQAEYYAVQILKDRIKILQSLGYLPEAARNINITTGKTLEQQIEEINKELEESKNILPAEVIEAHKAEIKLLENEHEPGNKNKQD